MHIYIYDPVYSLSLFPFFFKIIILVNMNEHFDINFIFNPNKLHNFYFISFDLRKYFGFFYIHIYIYTYIHIHVNICYQIIWYEVIINPN